MVVKGVQRGHETEGGDSPCHDGHPLRHQEVGENRRRREEPARDDDQRRTGRDGAVDVLHGHVEVKGSLVCHAILVRKGEGLDERVDEADDCTVAHDDALGCSRRARGKEHIRRVGIDPVRAGEGRRLVARDPREQALEKKHMRPRELAVACERSVAVGDHGGISQAVEDGPHAVLGRIRIDGNVVAACI